MENGMSFHRPTVLIADPHEEYRSGLVRAITMHRSLCLDSVAEDGFEALALIMTRKPDLALLDVRLAGLDAFRISERLNSEGAVLKTRIVLLTALLDPAQKARALSVGAVDCLAKDASRSEICDALVAVARGVQRNVDEPKSRVARRHPGPVGVEGG
jgi:two-component system, NarL family, nitrate/nitrite response regulator NarL